MRRKSSSTGIFLRLCFSPLTCRLSIGGITMTKLSGKKPQRPFSSPSHQPSSSVSFTWRLKSHISRVLWDVRLLYKRLVKGQARHCCLIIIFLRYFKKQFPMMQCGVELQCFIDQSVSLQLLNYSPTILVMD